MSEYNLSYNELYYLGDILEAKYVDYDYLASTDDFDTNYEMFRHETQSSLSSKNLILQDFSGGISVDAKLASILKPIFFGESECEINIIHKVDDSVSRYNKKIHVINEQKTFVKLEEESVKVSDDFDYDTVISESLKYVVQYEAVSQEPFKPADGDVCQTVVLLKYVEDLTEKPADAFFVFYGKIYKFDRLGELEFISVDEFKNYIKKLG